MDTIEAVNPEKLQALMGKLVVEMGAAANATLVQVGDRLGLFRALAESGSQTAQQLAERTGTAERYVREWLSAQAAGGYVEYDAASDRFSMTPEQVAILGHEDSPVYMGGGFYSINAIARAEDRLTDVFRSGEGIAWGDHHENLFCGTAKFFKPLYRSSLIGQWIPAVDGLDERLRRGAQVADVGCGLGASTLLMAEAYPESTFVGFDPHPGSIADARAQAQAAGLTNVTFEVGTAQTFEGSWDVVMMFDCLHDMSDPEGASRHVRSALAEDGVWMVVEPYAHDELQHNLNPVGRLYFAFSTSICTANALCEHGSPALGAQAGEARLTATIRAGGFRTVRRAVETPMNLVLDVRP